MKVSTFFTRRTLLGTGLASAVVPALGQTQSSRPRGQDRTSRRIQVAFGNHVFSATLYDNPSARDFASMLPLALTIEDYSNNEKIAYLPRKLAQDGSAPFGNERPGDLCYYVPWGNLVFYYGSYRYARSLIRLGRLDNGFEPLLTRGKFPLRISRLGSNS